MNLFFYIAIIGGAMMMLSRVQYKKITDRNFYRGNELTLESGKKNNFFVKIKNSFLYDLFYSSEFARMNRRYGTLMVLIGIGGMVLFKTIGIILDVLLLIVVFFCLFKFIVKFKKSTKKY